ncbi:MAG: Protein often near L-alanine-DL-glutamate epimerase (cell wall recycling) [uncultured Sphingosinicella sp.]|uniref:Protein often near L-alanine-DL-glutamate epimerase (Cell wall recycling) n=1 Tax=uncultured Sphingosinicella sp. TaxID=478748 RepID=A0A6J4UFN6_9SPHN|nr:DUF1611 domain-containing protein [uncultured Sphingosinicella sp.]CAA9549088.1 MAG: Protein often near L-alanine-DL-glutamate epimerase (cell wall recycling) [uncultured Sphingosinicella sp.]
MSAAGLAIEPGRDVATGLDLPQPYLLFLGDTTEPGYAKTAFGLRDWAPERCVGEFALPGATVGTGLPKLTPIEAKRQGAQSMVIGVANSGGAIPKTWRPALEAAVRAGLHIVSGMHNRLYDLPGLAVLAAEHNIRLIEVRDPPLDLPVANGRKRSGRRLLTVGTDCALGKKYTALTVARELNARGINATFRATGQTGIMIAGGGIPMDAVIADFAAGAAELLSPDAPPDHWDVIEGQGSLFHPAYAGVALALLHGSQPDLIIVCHEPGRTATLGHPAYAVPDIEQTIALNIQLGARTNPHIRCAGVSLNTSALSSEEAERMIAFETDRLGLPVADPLRGGAPLTRMIDAILARE